MWGPEAEDREELQYDRCSRQHWSFGKANWKGYTNELEEPVKAAGICKSAREGYGTLRNAMRTAAKHNIPRGRLGTSPVQRVMELPHAVGISTAADNAANAGDHEDYAALRAARREAIGKALNKDFCDNISKLTPWRPLRKWRNPSAGNTPAPLIVNGVGVTGAKEKSCALAEFYAEA